LRWPLSDFNFHFTTLHLYSSFETIHFLIPTFNASIRLASIDIYQRFLLACEFDLRTPTLNLEQGLHGTEIQLISTTRKTQRSFPFSSTNYEDTHDLNHICQNACSLWRIQDCAAKAGVAVRHIR